MSDINFVTVDAQTITSQLINDFETYTKEILYPGDARRIFLQGFAYVLINLLSGINTTGRSNLLRFAFKETLDALGKLYGTPRLEAHKATTIIKFILSEVQTQDIIIAIGTRVTPDGTLFFTTDKVLIIPAGNLSENVSVTATMAGKAYNGFSPGQINKLVDGNAYVASVTNTIISSGGTELESDDAYRIRIEDAPYSFSTAGPYQAYYYWAKNANPDIGDVDIISPSAGSIIIYALKVGGVIPEADDQIIIDIYNACNDVSRRPLTDNVSVLPVTAANTTIDVKYYISPNDTVNAATIQAAIIKSVSTYTEWQTSTIGRTINPDELRKLMLSAGASRVDVTAPSRLELMSGQIAQITSTAAVFMGLGD